MLHVIYPTPVPAKILGVSFGVDTCCWGERKS